ncbi:hypothetical protein COLO4_30985 [Corchorus olitorius]|uniref:RecA family profile 1 domain-containing protein n=1 Tax=Corchorus olitorius TaxID=93759 RepID=A0A1R3H6E3_9ROSI|nr:hypothetical protein COLO4_30985 [Corchorus olitorius]
MRPQNLLQLTTQKCTTGCPILDGLLRGGIPCNSVTEIVAESGSGKTQMCLQLSLHAQLPVSHGGLAASSLYLHTEFPFPFRRLNQLSLSFVSSNAPNLATNGNPCDRIFVQSVHTADQLLEIMSKIEPFMENSRAQPPVRLIVIDSVAALFRSEFDNTAIELKRRSCLFFKISSELKALAKSVDSYIVFKTEQLCLRFLFGKNFERATMIVDQKGVKKISGEPSSRSIFQFSCNSFFINGGPHYAKEALLQPLRLENGLIDVVPREKASGGESVRFPGNWHLLPLRGKSFSVLLVYAFTIDNPDVGKVYKTHVQFGTFDLVEPPPSGQKPDQYKIENSKKNCIDFAIGRELLLPCTVVCRKWPDQQAPSSSTGGRTLDSRVRDGQMG